MSFSEALIIQDEIDTKFTTQYTKFKKQITKFKNTILKNKNSLDKLVITTKELSKQLRVKREEARHTDQKIDNSKDIIKVFEKLKDNSINAGIKINSSISYDGYFLMAIEAKRSISRDRLSSAVFRLNSDFISKKLFNAIQIQTSKIEGFELLKTKFNEITPKEIIVNNLGFVVDKYFTNNGKAV